MKQGLFHIDKVVRQKGYKATESEKDNEIKRLKRANELLRDFFSRFWKEVRATITYQVIDSRKAKYPVSVMCKFFKVFQSGYCDYVRRKNKPQHDLQFAEMISKCQQRCGKTYGYRRVHIWLMREKSLYFNPKTVLRVMNKYGLLSEIRRRKKYKYIGQQVHKYENLLNRNFIADRPNAKWVTDISYIHTNQGIR